MYEHRYNDPFKLGKSPEQIYHYFLFISLQLAALGIFTLFFGVMAFNGSTVGHITQPGDGAKYSLSITNTVLSAAGAGLSAFAFKRLGWFIDKGREDKAWCFMCTVNGTFVGMVVIPSRRF